MIIFLKKIHGYYKQLKIISTRSIFPIKKFNVIHFKFVLIIQSHIII
jgi:hypothetical protein